MSERLVVPPIINGTQLLVRHTGNMFRYPSRNENGLTAAREHFLKLLHYRYEITAYAQAGVLVAKDLEKHGYASKSIDKVSQKKLVEKYIDYMILLFFFDDLQDNCPLRGDMVPYHLFCTRESLTSAYAQTKNDLIDSLAHFERDRIPELLALMDSFDNCMVAEGSDGYYTFGQQKSAVASFRHNRNKSSEFSHLLVLPFEIATSARRPPEWQNALARGCEASWLVNDLYKNSTQAGLGNWLDIKSGRIPLPVEVVLEQSPDETRGDLVAAIKQVWSIYEPYFRAEHLDLEVLKTVDKSKQAKGAMSQFKTIMNKSSVKEIIDRCVRDRMAYVKSVSVRNGGLDHLDFFLTSLIGYMGEKTLRGVFQRESMRPDFAAGLVL